RVDRLLFILCTVTGIMTLMVFAGMVYFAIRYRNGSKSDRSNRVHNSMPIEIGWTIATTLIFLALFAAGLTTYYEDFRPPAGAMEIYVIGRQWMWKAQHPDGRREINELHLPVGQSVRLTMTSEDVIHDFFIPAFRIKRDVLPGRYTEMWFRPTRTGTYHLFCSQYCGAFHAGMVGNIIVLEAPQYQQWLSSSASEPMARTGADLFHSHACDTCHHPGGDGPLLSGLPGRLVHLSDGTTIVADDTYIRESILTPATKIVAGYQPRMPTYQGQLSEAEIAALIAYIKSLGIEEQERSRP
ncbi:MAG: cytochrome c oxidase subunit II, partial [Acidobacteriota bacterium]|nr:cytochrome c oxidase subunit II [Acidobacteriota bacterium]